MRHLLLINPNTSAAVSAVLQRHAQQYAGEQVQVQTVTARFGAPYIACEASYAVAAHATLDAWAAAVARARAPFDAVLVGCFGDPGVLALRECCDVAVTGLAQAAFDMAAANGRFAIVTGGARWKPMLERLAHNLGYGDLLAGIQTVEQSGAELARDPVAAHAILCTACLDAVAQFKVDTLILGGAGLAGMAEPIQRALPFSVIDSVQAGVHQVLRAPAAAQPRAGRLFDFAWHRLAPELTALGHSG